MLSNAFKIRADVIVGHGDPAVLLDIDDRTLRDQQYQPLPSGWEPNASAPRALIAELLEYVRAAPAAKAPKAVVVDVDLGAPTPGDAAGVDKLKKALTDWAATPTAPTLIIAREAFPPSVVGLQGSVLALPTTAYDDVVATAPNIYWSTVKVLADYSGVVHEFLPFQCVQQNGRVQPLYSAALLAYGAMQGGKIPPNLPPRSGSTWRRSTAPRPPMSPSNTGSRSTTI